MFKPLLPLCALMLLWGCATSPSAPTSNVEAPSSSPEYVYDQGALGDLLLAEVSLQRDERQLALDYYQAHSTHSQSPAMSREASFIAYFAQQPQAALNEATHWLSLEPQSSEAHQVAALALIMLGNPQAATEHIDNLLATAGSEGLTDFLALSQDMPEEHTDTLVKTLASLATSYPQESALWYADAMLQQENGDPKAALRSLNKSLRITPEHTEAQLLKARLLFDTHRQNAALRHQRKLIKKHPNELRYQAQHIQFLLEANQDHAAQAALDTFAERHPDSQELRLAVGISAMKQGHYATAKNIMEGLLQEGYRSDEIHLYLAQSAEEHGDYNTALHHYQAVESSEAQLQARFQMAQLYHQQKNYEACEKTFRQLREDYPEQSLDLYLAEAQLWHKDSPKAALNILQQAQQIHGQQPDLLYLHALVLEQLGHIAQAEKNLRRILLEDPMNAPALNALGYILTDRTNRHEEAYEYIHQALTLAPDNPAILDSMGWVLFNLGRTEEALPYLEKSYTALKDDEVAEHLIKVLMKLNRSEEAQRLLEQHPELSIE